MIQLVCILNEIVLVNEIIFIPVGFRLKVIILFEIKFLAMKPLIKILLD